MTETESSQTPQCPLPSEDTLSSGDTTGSHSNWMTTDLACKFLSIAFKDQGAPRGLRWLDKYQKRVWSAGVTSWPFLNATEAKPCHRTSWLSLFSCLCLCKGEPHKVIRQSQCRHTSLATRTLEVGWGGGSFRSVLGTFLGPPISSPLC